MRKFVVTVVRSTSERKGALFSVWWAISGVSAEKSSSPGTVRGCLFMRWLTHKTYPGRPRSKLSTHYLPAASPVF